MALLEGPLRLAADRLPSPRGPMSREVQRILHGGRAVHTIDSPLPPGSPHDADFQLALWMLNAAQVAVIDGVDAHDASSLRARNLRWYLSRDFEARLRSLVPQPAEQPLRAVIDERRGLARRPSETPEVARDRFLGKAPYLAWEADPHTFALATIESTLKRPLAEIQAGEYGVGHGDTHATIFRSCVGELGLTLHEVLECAPSEAYAFANSAWLFGGDHRLRGAAIGQLCMLEMDSVEPCRAAAVEWDRLALPSAGRRWYDVHVLADADHAKIARDELIPAVEERAPHLLADACWGAAVTAELMTLVDVAVRSRSGGVVPGAVS